MKQRVRTVSYLAKAEFEFENGVYDLVALPSGAEVVKVSLEVAGNPTTEINGDVSVGFKDEINKDYFLSTLGGVIKKNCVTSDKDYTAVSNKVIVAEVKKVQPVLREGHIKGVLRVLYFLPSVIEVEY